MGGGNWGRWSRPPCSTASEPREKPLLCDRERFTVRQSLL